MILPLTSAHNWGDVNLPLFHILPLPRKVGWRPEFRMACRRFFFIMHTGMYQYGTYYYYVQNEGIHAGEAESEAADIAQFAKSDTAVAQGYLNNHWELSNHIEHALG